MKRIILIGMLLFVLQSCGLYTSNGIERQKDTIKNTTLVSCKQRYFIRNSLEIFYVTNEFVLEKDKLSETLTSFFTLNTSQNFGKIDTLAYVKINGKIFTKTIRNFNQNTKTETKTDTETIKDSEDKNIEIITGFKSDSRLIHQFELNYTQEELLEFQDIKTLSFQFYKNKKPIIIHLKASELVQLRNIFVQKQSN